MNIKEYAKSISGKEYGYPQFTKEEIETAEENGFIIVYGASDDLMEFDGDSVMKAGALKAGKFSLTNMECVMMTRKEKIILTT